MIYCRTCKAHFSERKGTVLEHAKLAKHKALAVLEHLRDGNGTRATARLVGIDKDTVTRYVRLAGNHAKLLHDELVEYSPRTKEVQYDEKWSFVRKKRSALHAARVLVR
jgi:LacI family transcriptional regulator